MCSEEPSLLSIVLIAIFFLPVVVIIPSLIKKATENSTVGFPSLHMAQGNVLLFIILPLIQ
jgi:hypothetical protein